jgi:hypothetical protein
LPRVFRISCQLLWLTCMSMPAGAASSSALPWPLVSRPESRQSRPRTLVFLGKTCGFVVEVQDSNQVSSNRSSELPEQRCRECSRRPSMQDDWLETAHHSSKFLLSSRVFRIVQLAVTAILRDRLHGCGLQGLD